MTADVEDALKWVEEIHETIDDMPSDKLHRGASFFNSVDEGATSLGKTIEKTGREICALRKKISGRFGHR